MTLSDLAMHFGVRAANIRAANPRMQGSDLRAGRSYVVPVEDLAFSQHDVRRGETLTTLTQQYGLPTIYTIRALNCLPSARIEAGDALLVFQAKKPTVRKLFRATKAARPAFSTRESMRWVKKGVYDMDPANGLMRFQVSQGMTLSELALAFGAEEAGIRITNALAPDAKLLAGQQYWIPTGHLKATLYQVREKDTLSDLASSFLVDADDIKVWNGLRTDAVKVGQKLLVLQ
jgi:LysM repeat protein